MALNFGLIGDLTFAECIKVNRSRRVKFATYELKRRERHSITIGRAVPWMDNTFM